MYESLRPCVVEPNNSIVFYRPRIRAAGGKRERVGTRVNKRHTGQRKGDREREEVNQNYTNSSLMECARTKGQYLLASYLSAQ